MYSLKHKTNYHSWGRTATLGPVGHELAKKPTHEDEKIALLLALAGGFAIWNIFR